MKSSLKTILLLNTSDDNYLFLYQTLKSSYNILATNNVEEAEKILDNNKDVLCVIVDFTSDIDIASKFIIERKNNYEYMSIHVLAITISGDKNAIGIARENDVTNIISLPLQDKNILRDINSIEKRNEIDEMRFQDKFLGKIDEINKELFEAFELVPFGVYIFTLKNNDINITYANDACISMFPNIKPNDQTFFSHLNNDDSINLLTAIKNAERDLNKHTVNFTFEDNGEVRHFVTNITRTQSNTSNVSKYVCTVVDVTNDVKNEMNVENNNQVISTVFDCLDGGLSIVRCTPTGIVLEYINKSLSDILGYEKKEINIESLLSNEEKIRLLPELRKIAKSSDNSNGIFSARTKLITKNDGEKIVMVKGRKIADDDLDSIIALVIFDITEEQSKEEKLRFLAEHDQTTGLFNQQRFYSLAERMIQDNDEVMHTLAIFDIYHFRVLKTVLSKSSVEKLLKVIANGLEKFAPNSLIGKIENDLYGICTESDNIDIKQLYQNLDNYIKEEFPETPVKIYCGVYNIDDPYVSIDTLIIRTQYVLSEIKGSALKKIAYCDSGFRVRRLQTDDIRNSMEKALENKEFEVFLQPVFDIDTRKIVSAEALTRWHHPKRGYISPGEFIPIFEENGFIVKVDDFVWESVCKLIRSWMDKKQRVIPISVNVSRIDLFNINFYERITNLVESYDILPEYLRLEITESAYTVHEELIIETVNKLRRYGFPVLMDDFGSGYSSLNSLKDINIDILKIDMELVKGIEKNTRNAKILQSVISLANSLDLSIISEGVETELQAQFISECGCKKAQGWLFSKAVPIEEFQKMLDNE